MQPRTIEYNQWVRFHSLVDTCAILSKEQDYNHPSRALSPQEGVIVGPETPQHRPEPGEFWLQMLCGQVRCQSDQLALVESTHSGGPSCIRTLR